LAVFVAFDLLRLNGEICARVRWRSAGRRSRGSSPRGAATASCSARRSREEGAVVFAKACELGLEGIVSKRAGSLYKSGKSRSWLKTMNPDFVRT
jgi:bifunctional non-homologous end joining protein LigD